MNWSPRMKRWSDLGELQREKGDLFHSELVRGVCPNAGISLLRLPGENSVTRFLSIA
jgi:hypothetical protein